MPPEEKVLKTALKWFTKAAEQGDSDAQMQLAEYYLHDYPVKRDQKKAAIWLSRAEQQGNVDARSEINQHSMQGMLGKCYFLGDGVERDY